MTKPIDARYDIVYFFDITDGNPNGDPDAGNLPRLDPETGQGLVTDVCLKRKIRNYVELAGAGKPGLRVFVREGAILNRQIEEAYDQSEEVKQALEQWLKYEAAKKNKKLKEKPTQPTQHYEDIARRWMCDQFFDVRAFGAVMTTGKEKSAGSADEDEGAETSRAPSKIRRT